MGELALNLGLLVLSLALAALGAVLGAWFQHRNWKNQHWQGIREQRIEAAAKIVEDLARLIDRRLYRQRRLLWATRHGNPADLDAAVSDYRDAVFEWMDNIGRIKAELWRSFDRYTAVRFEEELHDKFASIGRTIEARVRKKRGGLLSDEERKLNSLGRSSYEFVHVLLQRIADENLNGLTGRDNVSFDNWDNLSSGFLFRRLFGISA